MGFPDFGCFFNIVSLQGEMNKRGGRKMNVLVGDRFRDEPLWVRIAIPVLGVFAVSLVLFMTLLLISERRAKQIDARDPAYIAAIEADLEHTPLAAGDIVIYVGGETKFVDQLVLKEQPWLLAPETLAFQLDGVVRYEDDPARWAQFARTLVATGCKKAGKE